MLAAAACTPADQTPVEPDQTEAIAAPAAEVAPERPEFVGVVTSRRSEVIPAAFTGRITRMNVHPGQRVHAGDSIARLDDTDLRSQIAGFLAEERAARASAGASGAMVAAARSKLAAERRLVAIGASPRMAITNATAELSSQGAQSAAAASQGGVARAKREVIERQVAKAELTSPLDGVIMMVRAKEGEVAQAGSPIARVFDPRDLIIRFAVPKELRSQLGLGTRVELRLESVERPVWATIERMADEEAPINFTVVEADIDDSKLSPDEVQVASVGRVRIAEARGAKRGAQR